MLVVCCEQICVELRVLLPTPRSAGALPRAFVSWAYGGLHDIGAVWRAIKLKTKNIEMWDIPGDLEEDLRPIWESAACSCCCICELALIFTRWRSWASTLLRIAGIGMRSAPLLLTLRLLTNYGYN